MCRKIQNRTQFRKNFVCEEPKIKNIIFHKQGALKLHFFPKPAMERDLGDIYFQVGSKWAGKFKTHPSCGRIFPFRNLKSKNLIFHKQGALKPYFLPKHSPGAGHGGYIIFRGVLNGKENSKPNPVGKEYFVSGT